MSLPDDVLDYIFSFLQSDFRALKACAQSHPKIIPLVERHLYANIELVQVANTVTTETSGHDVRTVDSFVGLLSDKPHIANYVRSLDIAVALDVTEWLENLASILPMCSLLNKITFGSSTQPTGELLEWVSLPENFRQAFLDCLHLPSMQAVSITLVSGFPMSALNHSKSVKSLTLCGWTPGPDFIVETPRYPLLEDLAIQDCSREAVGQIITWVQPRNLRSLEVLLASHDTEQLSRFFPSCSNTLTNLILDIKNKFQTSYQFELGYASTVNPITTMFLSLSSLLCLERLTICADLEFYVTFRCSRDSGVIQFKSSIPSITRVLRTALPLQHLALNFRFRPGRIPYDSEYLWSPLVTLISESPSPCVNLRVMGSRFSDEMIDYILSSFSRCTDLTRMVEQGVLVITPIRLEPPPPIEEPVAVASHNTSPSQQCSQEK